MTFRDVAPPALAGMFQADCRLNVDRIEIPGNERSSSMIVDNRYPILIANGYRFNRLRSVELCLPNSELAAKSFQMIEVATRMIQTGRQ